MTPKTSFDKENVGNFPIPAFWETSFWEPVVQLAILQYCRPGQVVFDVGANAGALTALMSRLVGPRGVVFAFEASPRIVAKTHHNLVGAGCGNTQLIQRAVYRESGSYVKMYPGTHLNDSIYNDHGAAAGPSFEVETLALDDLVRDTGLMPSFVKMDIEGAEYDALLGAANIISFARPVFVLEQSPGDMRCHQLLVDAEYTAVDLSSYRTIRSKSDFDPGVGIANVLFIPNERVAGDPYVACGSGEEVARLEAHDFDRDSSGGARLRIPLALTAGRYRCVARFESSHQSNEVFAGIDSNRGRLFRYHAYSGLLASSYRDWTFHLWRDASISPFLEFVRGSDPALKWHGASIVHYPAFSNLRAPTTW